MPPAPHTTTPYGARQGFAPGAADVEVGQVFTASSLGRAYAKHLTRTSGNTTATLEFRDGPIKRRVTFRPVSHGNGFASYARVEAVTVLPVDPEDD
jgi:hypothetical protein